MPAHFLWQEDSLRREWELRSTHHHLPMWGIVELVWDEELLRSSGRLLITRLELVFETRVLVDVPGNARPVSLDLPKSESDPIDVYLHLESEPEVIRGGWPDGEGSLIDLRMQKLALATRPLKTPSPGFHLLRLSPYAPDVTEKPKQKATGWVVDPSYVPPMIDLFALREFGLKRFESFNRMLAQWKQKLRVHAVENTLGVHKRVEANLCLRRAHGLSWYLGQVSPTHQARMLSEEEPSHRDNTAAAMPSIIAHPFEFFSQMVGLYLDVFTFRCGPLQTIQQHDPLMHVYEHGNLSGCFAALETSLETELNRPGAGSPEWVFKQDNRQPARRICEFPQQISLDCEMYFVVQFDEEKSEAGTNADGVDARLCGLKLAAPDRLLLIQRQVLPGIPLERVRLVPFPHDFDSNVVQFYRLRHGSEWVLAQQAGAVAYHCGERRIQRAFLYTPDVRA